MLLRGLGARYDYRVDVWALGCVLVCLATASRLPYPDDVVDDVKLIKKIASGAVRPLLPASSVLFSCARSCCQLEAADRPKADETLAQLDRAMMRVETMKSRAEARRGSA